MKALRRKKKLWSVPRIKDPRFPGFTVRVTELVPGGPLYYVRTVAGKQRMASLGITRAALGSDGREQENRARALAFDLIAELAGKRSSSRPALLPPASHGLDKTPLSFRHLVDHAELRAWRNRTQSYRRESIATLRRIEAFFGPDKPVASLSRSDLEGFIEHERHNSPRPLRDGTIAAHLAILTIILNWAVEERLPDGRQLLEVNPLSRIRLKKLLTREEPRRPWATPERYQALRAAVGRTPPLTPGRQRKQERQRKPIPEVFGCVLDLAWLTGHRLSAILGLRWEDVDFDHTSHAPDGTIRWYAGCRNSNKRHEHVVQMNERARRALERWRALRPGIGSALIFPSRTNPLRPLEYSALKGWLRDAEGLAGLPHEPQGGWHMFRRGWATARKHLPLKDVAMAGGWTDTATLVTSYLHADPRTMLSVVAAGQ